MSDLTKKTIAVFGCGAWSTVLVNHLSQTVVNNKDYNESIIWYVDELDKNGNKISEDIKIKRENVKYLPGYNIRSNVTIESDLLNAASHSDVIFYIYCDENTHQLLTSIADSLKPDTFFVSFSKGFIKVDGRLKLVSEEIFKSTQRLCVIVGGTIDVRSLCRNEVSEAIIASSNVILTEETRRLIMYPNLIIYLSLDAITVEVFGCLKPILYLIAGILHGLNVSQNTKAAVLRLAFCEFSNFIQDFYSSLLINKSTLLQCCGISEVFLCMLKKIDDLSHGGADADSINMVLGCMLTSEKHSKKSVEELQGIILNGQLARGPQQIKLVYSQIQYYGVVGAFQILDLVYCVVARILPTSDFIERLKFHPRWKSFIF